jgi:hypothetical protein
MNDTCALVEERHRNQMNEFAVGAMVGAIQVIAYASPRTRGHRNKEIKL